MPTSSSTSCCSRCACAVAKPAPLFALDTHAGRGLYHLAAPARSAPRGRRRHRPLIAENPPRSALRRYLEAVSPPQAARRDAYPARPGCSRARCARSTGSRDARCSRKKRRCRGDARRRPPRARARRRWLRRHALPAAATDGESARPRPGADRPPYETQLAEFDTRWPRSARGCAASAGVFALWYPIKFAAQAGSVQRRAADLPAKSVLVAELLVRPTTRPCA